uniref:Uncharacterized protein n=1 Tax=Candidatus Kentrum sp. MB TaxID=2138164 RepID=A0A450XDS3_9GAMM|nr:MAG: hypothetical protein BECKMB1821G_GA0114241_10288 [Candidatus Kentron sp. MB]VFK32022.1 MAG: hypothetical protein BECKMB1821I_GA0114274_10297 [Candidatus Kentron sp. MB]VFK75676.1 MAG: hypothetical protein BECKMB1821H_GA0114242_102841 [Candidatus Kentron sp. MB]
MFQRKDVPAWDLFSGFRKMFGRVEGENWGKNGTSQEGYDWRYAVADQRSKQNRNILDRFRPDITTGESRTEKNRPCQMTLSLEEIRASLSIQADKGGGYNRNAAWEMLAQVECGYGQQAVDELIREFDLESTFDFKPGNSFLSGKE